MSWVSEMAPRGMWQGMPSNVEFVSLYDTQMIRKLVKIAYPSYSNERKMGFYFKEKRGGGGRSGN